MNSFRKHKLLKHIDVIFEVLIFVLIIVAAVFLLERNARSEDLTEAYIICVPGDQVNIRSHPNTKREPEGWLDPGDMVYLDGKKKSGFMHCVGLTTEAGEGWVHKGYLVDEEPVYLNQNATIISRGRLAARKYVNGKRTRWLKPLATVKIYYWTSEWAVTNCGYIKSKYLELEGE